MRPELVALFILLAWPFFVSSEALPDVSVRGMISHGSPLTITLSRDTFSSHIQASFLSQKCKPQGVPLELILVYSFILLLQAHEAVFVLFYMVT